MRLLQPSTCDWLSFTAFPSIPAIVVMDWLLEGAGSRLWHGSDFHDINIYSAWRSAQSKQW
jgi:hypothetical protein